MGADDVEVNLPPDYCSVKYATDAAPKWFEMNKANVMEIIDPNRIVDGSLFVDESPRETWSHGE